MDMMNIVKKILMDEGIDVDQILKLAEDISNDMADDMVDDMVDDDDGKDKLAPWAYFEEGFDDDWDYVIVANKGDNYAVDGTETMDEVDAVISLVSGISRIVLGCFVDKVSPEEFQKMCENLEDCIFTAINKSLAGVVLEKFKGICAALKDAMKGGKPDDK